jgi:hypothetical protein
MTEANPLQTAVRGDGDAKNRGVGEPKIVWQKRRMGKSPILEEAFQRRGIQAGNSGLNETEP